MNKIKLDGQVVTAVVIFLSFFALYIFFSLLAQTGSFSNYGIFFELDTSRVVGDMTVFDANHHHNKVHPLFVLLVNPAGMLLSNLFEDVFFGLTTSCYPGMKRTCHPPERASGRCERACFPRPKGLG